MKLNTCALKVVMKVMIQLLVIYNFKIFKNAMSTIKHKYQTEINVKIKEMITQTNFILHIYTLIFQNIKH